MSSANPSSPKGAPGPAQAARRSLAGFWDRVSDGMALGQIWQQFQAEATATYGFYSRGVDWESIREKKGLAKAFAVASAFFWSLVMKLTPARRVALLVALGALLVGDIGYPVEGVSASFNFRALGILILLLLLALELADRVTMKRDLEIARDIQRWLVPAAPPAVEGVDMAFATRPANTVAGDYHDAFFRAPHPAAPGRQRLLLTVADVAGKSVPAALLMATLQSSLHALAAAPTTLVELVAALNRATCARSLGGLRFTTAFLGEYDPAGRVLDYVCAGHNPAVLRRVSGEAEQLEIGGLPLGIDSAASYQQGRVTLGPGDVLLIFTDGLVEAVNAGDEEYGLERVLELLNIVPGESAAETLRHLLEDVDRFTGRAPQHDDITCLVLRLPV